MEKIKNYPSHIARPFTAFTQADDESAMHKSLLDMGESFLTYLVGIMFGEYIPKEDIAEEKEESHVVTLGPSAKHGKVFFLVIIIF